MSDALTLTRGQFVVLACDGRELRAFVALASANGDSVLVMFDGMIDGCIEAMPLLRRDGTFRSVFTGHAIDVRIAEQGAIE